MNPLLFSVILPCIVVFFLIIVLICLRKNVGEAVLYERALQEFSEEDYAEARHLLLKAIKKNPNFIDALHTLGLVYFKYYDFTAAKKCFEQILEKDPDNFNAVYNYALSFQRLKQNEDAKTYYYKAISLNDKDFDTFYNLGILFFNEKNYEDAMSNFKKALAILPNKTSVMLNIAKCKDEQTTYTLTEDSQDVIATYLKIAESGGELPSGYHISLATAYAKIGNVEKAKEYCKKAIEHSADDVENYKLLGLIYLVKNDVQKAKESFDIALELEPGHSEVCKILKYVYK